MNGTFEKVVGVKMERIVFEMWSIVRIVAVLLSIVVI